MTFATTKNYDVIIIGAGPGGEGAAMKAAKSGKSVAIVDRHFAVGGGCVHWGTIPSKTLRFEIVNYVNVMHNPLFRSAMSRFEIQYPDLLRSAQSVIDRQVELRRRFYLRNNVDVYHGMASFVDEHTVIIEFIEGGSEYISADAFVLASGSRPYHPAEVDFSHPRILDADTVLSLQETPRSLTVYGAGVIGCEYASIFRSLDIKVNLINTRAKLLDFMDDEIVDALSYHMRDQGILIRHNEEFARIEPLEDGVCLHLKSGKQLFTDYLLWANGRTGNTDYLGLDEVNIEVDSRKRIPVNENYQTDIPHIYAVGDVVGFPGLASAAYDQGRFASTHIVEGGCDKRLVEHIPTGIWTSPEISSVGPTERELTAQRVPYEVGHALFRSLARAQIERQNVGMLKLLFHRESLAILGIHCFGPNAIEIIHIGQAIMSQTGEANTLEYFVNTTFNYPTMAEAYRVAALNGLNRVR